MKLPLAIRSTFYFWVLILSLIILPPFIFGRGIDVLLDYEFILGASSFVIITSLLISILNYYLEIYLDKNPESFFRVLKMVQEEGSDFGLVILGENFSKSPTVFEKIKKELSNHIVQWGYANSFKEYAEWLWKSDIMPVTSNQEFFGASVMEAIYCDTWPILPNRLTYPELIPSEWHHSHIYKDEEDLFNKIKWAMDNIEKIKKSKIARIAKKYDWNEMAKIYDQTIRTI